MTYLSGILITLAGALIYKLYCANKEYKLWKKIREDVERVYAEQQRDISPPIWSPAINNIELHRKACLDQYNALVKDRKAAIEKEIRMREFSDIDPPIEVEWPPYPGLAMVRPEGCASGLLSRDKDGNIEAMWPSLAFLNYKDHEIISRVYEDQLRNISHPQINEDEHKRINKWCGYKDIGTNKEDS